MSSIVLYTDQTPNGIKVSITLEELGLPYEVKHIDISTNVQKEPWFLEINPNGRIPAITDRFTDGSKICVFESGAIMQYLVDRYDVDNKISYERGTRQAVEVNNWLFFQNAGVGPMQGQANHFIRYAPTKIKYGMKRYRNETRRLYSVLDTHLSKGTKYLVDDRCTIADISHWGWITHCGFVGVDVAEFPYLKAWRDRMLERPALERGRHVPTQHKIKPVLGDGEEDHSASKNSDWIMKANSKDLEED